MIEADLYDFLTANITVPAFATVPKDRPKRFVTFERTGGSIDTFRDLPTFAIQSWAQTVAEAAALADEVRAVLPRLVELADVAKVTVGGTYNFPDPGTKQARYQTVVDLVVKWNHDV